MHKFYGASFMTADKILKGQLIQTWIIMSGMSMGRKTVKFGSHCLSDDHELVRGFIVNKEQEIGAEVTMHVFSVVEL